jgi:ribosomal protein S12 methylthiotransferase accessory factor
MASAPTPYSLFLASLGPCAGIYVLGFCKQRNLPTEGIKLIQRTTSNHMTGRTEQIDLEIQVPPEFPEKYYQALVRSAEQCKVKQAIDDPPVFNVFTKVKE